LAGGLVAEIFLKKKECTRERLPEACIVCGEPSDDVKRITFNWRPAWADLFIFFGIPIWLILIILLTKKMRVECPVCESHRMHWKKKEWRTYGLLALLFFGSIALLAVTAALSNTSFALQVVFGSLVAVNVLGCLIGIVVVHSRGVRPKVITDRSITLKGVHPNFVTAAETELADQGDDRPRGRLRDAYDDDEDRPRRRRDRDDEE
jgi:hypothetical protein